MLVAILALLGAAAWSEEPAASDVRRILIVYHHDSTLVANIEAAAGIEAALSAGLAARRETYSEFRDLERFPGPDHDRRFAEMLAAKYGDAPLDVVVAAGPGALRFVLDHRDAFALGVPIVFGGVSQPEFDAIAPPPGVFGVVSNFDVRRSVELARRLQPDATRLVVMSGTAAHDRERAALARRELEGRVPGLELEFVSDLSLDGFKARAAALDRDTILLLIAITEDASGRKLLPRAAAAEVVAVSGAPAYAIYSSLIGVGFVGGDVETFAAIGEAMGALALQVLADPAAAPSRATTPDVPVIDWRQIRRWGIDPQLLPSDTLRLFYDRTAWERYRTQILVAGIVILLQTATIAGLVVQDRRRRQAERSLAIERLELAHISRTAQLGELSGALAHELNQPLTSILANAEAGARLIEHDPPDLKEIAEILGDIAEDDRRAAGIIAQLRRLMLKGDTALDAIDLNHVIAATVALARSELVARQTKVEIRLNLPEMTVSGNMAQLQQIVLNLMLNSAEAMSDLAPAARQLTIETLLRDNGWRELVVSDLGRGLAPGTREDVFKPFVSSKPQGLGFGLSICRTIAQAHGGTLAFDDGVAGGARIVLALPPP